MTRKHRTETDQQPSEQVLGTLGVRESELWNEESLSEEELQVPRETIVSCLRVCGSVLKL